MSRLDDIYTNVFAKSRDAIPVDQELENIIEEEVISPIENFTELTEDEIRDLIFAASSCAEKEGFKAGFKYALNLLIEV